MRWTLQMMTLGLALIAGACANSSKTPTSPTDDYEPPIVQDSFAGTISALTSTTCSTAFVRSVHPSYYQQGTDRCFEFPGISKTAGIVKAVLSWPDWHVDLDLVINDGIGANFAQGIGGNKSGERVDAFVNAGTAYVFVVHLQGVDTFFLAGGGRFPGEVATPFTISVERPR